jgi:hypothetical protein
MRSEPSTIQVRLLHFVSLVLLSISSALAAYCFYVGTMKDYAGYPSVKTASVSSSWNTQELLRHREMTDLTQVTLLWAGCALVGVLLSLASYYVIKGSVRVGDQATYDKAFPLFIFCVLLPLAAAFLLYNNMPYISRS